MVRTVRFLGLAAAALWLLAHVALVVRAVRHAGRFHNEVTAARDYAPRHSRD